ncbi:hypothetical protein BT63DRAFT_472405 [Microthyrium microscopicum]|uniref:Uncharacterized protein n=1 Tax=Microthyrium microscopicum TaxID=703497 RepID=A0A6A6UA10_9PEZI|nr:hypothetical protein BT63DRAFT_472405 [Microthyrium microscopicum]
MSKRSFADIAEWSTNADNYRLRRDHHRRRQQYEERPLNPVSYRPVYQGRASSRGTGGEEQLAEWPTLSVHSEPYPALSANQHQQMTIWPRTSFAQASFTTAGAQQPLSSAYPPYLGSEPSTIFNSPYPTVQGPPFQQEISNIPQLEASLNESDTALLAALRYAIEIETDSEAELFNDSVNSNYSVNSLSDGSEDEPEDEDEAMLFNYSVGSSFDGSGNELENEAEVESEDIYEDEGRENTENDDSEDEAENESEDHSEGDADIESDDESEDDSSSGSSFHQFQEEPHQEWIQPASGFVIEHSGQQEVEDALSGEYDPSTWTPRVSPQNSVSQTTTPPQTTIPTQTCFQSQTANQTTHQPASNDTQLEGICDTIYAMQREQIEELQRQEGELEGQIFPAGSECTSEAEALNNAMLSELECIRGEIYDLQVDQHSCLKRKVAEILVHLNSHSANDSQFCVAATELADTHLEMRREMYNLRTSMLKHLKRLKTELHG